MIRVDGRDIEHLGLAGLRALGQAFISCREKAVKLEVDLSQSVRRVLDSVSLSWLGVLDEGPRLEGAVKEARAAHMAHSMPRESPEINRS